MKAIIVEDEYHPRETLRQKLAAHHPEVEVLRACETAESALVEILRLQPDLVFLDIQLPGKNGLWLAEQMHLMAGESFAPPGIIFTTAFTDSEYLLNAIRVAAIDYLIKPIAVDDLAIALERFGKKRESTAPYAPSFLKAIEEEKLLTFRNYGGLILLKPEDIAYIEADGNYSVIVLANGEPEDIFERLGEIERRLPPTIFLRLGKSLIVNRLYIREINSKKFTLRLITPQASLTVGVPKNSIRGLREGLGV